MKMNEIGLCLANPPNQSRANGSRCQVTDSPHPRYLNSRIDGFGAPPVIARNHDLNVHGLLQLPTKCAEMALHSSSMRGINLSDMEHQQAGGMGHPSGLPRTGTS